MAKYSEQEREKIFLYLITPMNFRSNFESKRHFIQWLEFQTIDDLQITLDKFVIAELFEDACLIRDVINKKKLKKLMK